MAVPTYAKAQDERPARFSDDILTTALERNDRLEGIVQGLESDLLAVQRAHRAELARAKVLSDQLNDSRRQANGWQAQLVDTREAMADLKNAVTLRQHTIDDLMHHLSTNPVTNESLLQHYHAQEQIIQSLKGVLSCPLCYETFGRRQVVTLACGHTLCQTCLEQWVVRSSTVDPDRIVPECPECRREAPKSERVKVYMLEEAVRVIERLERFEFMPPGYTLPPSSLPPSQA
ncbi:uncharacterized protein L969DRAFT_302527 [Mixia osmundae IAM 14324]|uniref:RING-type domain-containing protein n=1 Tax=Mixia osmundae (strain CBS 9802 / IAM 14324 / JCM 22182 / KY 12970) TaxID=764103 RepID=G7DY03_MIXOS|nr:uncharacterized protein L969DRAFT_302527 [Mixia osmundae IAM 14324]KEI41363.1 hypothetical protein L969DRAFT_302527 [Mixia osmundae IAM 14324]GAA95463.1 hypothetical protein E5Q_02117 [Mixia osmundae IAM 14324]